MTESWDQMMKDPLSAWVLTYAGCMLYLWRSHKGGHMTKIRLHEAGSDGRCVCGTECEARYAPGPWTVGVDAEYLPGMTVIRELNNPGGRVIAALDSNDEQDAANAHLIAAAPDLLAALTALVRLPLDTGNVEAALRAIAKAEGREVAK